MFKSSEASSVCGFLLGFIHFYSYVLFVIKMPSFQLLLVFIFTVDVAFSSRFTFTFLRSSVSSADLLSVSDSFYSIHCVVLCHTSCFLCLVMCLLPHLIIFVGFSCVTAPLYIRCVSALLIAVVCTPLLYLPARSFPVSPTVFGLLAHFPGLFTYYCVYFPYISFWTE